MFQYFDIHSHIHGKEYDLDRKDVLARMRELGVGTITVGTYLESSSAAVALAESEENVFSAVGLHPSDTKNSFDYLSFKELALHPKVVAIGECGLDYFRLESDEQKQREEKERQKRIFLEQAELALEVGKPLMIHCRPSGPPRARFAESRRVDERQRVEAGKTMDAHEDMLSILNLYFILHKSSLRGNIHFFTGTIDIARRYFELGFTVSFPGVITFAPEYEQLILDCPIDMIMSETDSPYASPVPYRGKRNEPIHVIETVRKISSVLGKSEEEVALETVQNAHRVFGTPL